MRAKKPRHPLSRAEVSDIIKRLLKPEVMEARGFKVSTETILFYRTFLLFPDAPFWRVYDPGFLLNSIAYFLTDEGQEKVHTDIAVFHLDLPPHQPYTLGDKQGDDVPITRRAGTTAALLSPAQRLGHFNPLDHEQTR